MTSLIVVTQLDNDMLLLAFFPHLATNYIANVCLTSLFTFLLENRWQMVVSLFLKLFKNSNILGCVTTEISINIVFEFYFTPLFYLGLFTFLN